jgi:hypothetical protein
MSIVRSSVEDETNTYDKHLLKEDIAWRPKVSYLALKHILCTCHPNKILQPLCRVYESNLSKKCKYTSIVRDLKDDTNLY